MLQRIAEFTARCEKYVGTESGGMDQAISIMGDKGLAKLVHFKPVRLQGITAIRSRSGVCSQCIQSPYFQGLNHRCWMEMHAFHLPYVMLHVLP